MFSNLGGEGGGGIFSTKLYRKSNFWQFPRSFSSHDPLPENSVLKGWIQIQPYITTILNTDLTMVLILDGNAEHEAQACRKIDLFGGKKNDLFSILNQQIQA